MNPHLHIGITQRLPGWELLLEQIGVEWSVLPEGSVPSPKHYSAIIATSPLPANAHHTLYYYAEQGGAFLDAAPGGLRHPVQSLFPSPSDPLFGHIPLVDIFGMVRTFRGGLLGGTVAIAQRGRGCIAQLGIDIGRTITDTHKRRKMFYSPSGPFPNEMVARVSKGAIRMAVATLLKELHFRRGLPFVHKRPFPGTSPNVFCFRIDSDGGSRSQVRTWCELADKHDIPMSWYLHLENYDQWLDVLRNYPEQELGIHSVVHKTYKTFEENSHNIEQARNILKAHSIHNEGYAAPYGTWNEGVALAEEHHNFAYASEFSLCYDDLPFFPLLGRRFSPVLQVPIHPICPGNFKRAGMTEAQMNAYNQFALNTKLCDGEPLIFYDHPLHPYTGVIDELFGYVRSLGIPALSFAQYAAWWKRRHTSRISAQWYNSSLTAARTHAYDDVLLDVWHSHSEQSILHADGILSKVETPRVRRPEPQQSIRAVRKFSKVVMKQTAVDAINKWRKG